MRVVVAVARNVCQYSAQGKQRAAKLSPWERSWWWVLRGRRETILLKNACDARDQGQPAVCDTRAWREPGNNMMKNFGTVKVFTSFHSFHCQVACYQDLEPPFWKHFSNAQTF